MPYANLEQRRAYHRMKSRLWMRKETAKRRAAGVCVSCRTPCGKFRQCLDCRKARSAYHQAVVKPKLRALASRCVDCRRKCVRPGARRCGTCSARYANQVRWGKVA